MFNNKLQWSVNRNSYISIRKMHLKMPSAKWRPFCLGLNVLNMYIVNPVVNSNSGVCDIFWYIAVMALLSSKSHFLHNVQLLTMMFCHRYYLCGISGYLVKRFIIVPLAVYGIVVIIIFAVVVAAVILVVVVLVLVTIMVVSVVIVVAIVAIVITIVIVIVTVIVIIINVVSIILLNH